MRIIAESEALSATGQLAAAQEKTNLALKEGRFVDLSEVFEKHDSRNSVPFVKDVIKKALPRNNITFHTETDSEGNERHYFVTN